MHTRGSFAPETEAAARERYEMLGSTAQVVVKQVAKAMEFDGAEYDQRVTPAVVETARDAIFASALAVTVGTREEYAEWLEMREYEVLEVGSENVTRVAWHAVPFAGEVVAATFENEEDAAVETLRRQAFGHVYRDRLTEPV